MITANFSAYSTYVTDSLFQWDQNRVLRVTGLNLKVKPEVHFSNANMNGAIPVQADLVNHVVVASIPNSLLQEPLRIYAHIGIYEGDEFKVVELVEIPVKPRKRPADYELAVDDFELYSFKRLENMLSNAATKDQVANIVASVTTDSELIDVRYGADGMTYASAGEAVREQVKYCIDNMRYLMSNLFDIFTKVGMEDKGFYNLNGTWSPFNTTYSTGLIDVSAFEQLTLLVDASNYGTHALTFWDESGVFLSYQSVNKDETTLSVPDGAKYIRLAVYYAEATPKILAPFDHANDEKMQAELESIKTTLETLVGNKYNSFSILGDSFSTFVGFTDPVENNQYYPTMSEDVLLVRSTWWHQFAAETGITLQKNNSYSGSRISKSAGDGQSFADRVDNLGKPDLVIVEGATNDSADNVGEYKYTDWTEDDLACFRPALAYTLNYLREHNPGAAIVFMLNNGLNKTIIESVETVCEYYAVPVLYLESIDKSSGHPTVEGMRQIKEQLISFLSLN